MQWKDNQDGKSTAVQFGPFILQGVRADFDEQEPISAAVQLIDDNGNTLVEEEIDGNPHLVDLRAHAVLMMMRWVGELNMAMDRLLLLNLR